MRRVLEPFIVREEPDVAEVRYGDIYLSDGGMMANHISGAGEADVARGSAIEGRVG